MPSGVYKRTQKHINICREAGRQSAKSKINIERYQSSWEIRECPICNKKFQVVKSRAKKYCSLECANKCPERIAKITVHMIGKARHIQKHTEEAKRKMSFSKRGNNPLTYAGIHDWIEVKMGKPSKCEICGTIKAKFEWANKDHKYREDVNDWMRLCIKCHKKYDAKKRRENKKTNSILR